MTTLDISTASATWSEREDRRTRADRFEREQRGLVPGDREREAAALSAAGWGPYKPETTLDDIRGVTAATAARVRRVELSQLAADVRRAVKRWAPKYRRDAAETLATDALLILLRWEHHGDRERIDLGPDGATPLRRAWRETRTRADGQPETVLTRGAWRALHAAVKQAAETGSFLADVETEHDAATAAGIKLDELDVLDVAAAVETEQREAIAPVRLPDTAAAETVAAAMDITLDAARAIVERAYPHASMSELAAQWGIGEQAARNALSRGRAALLKRYPSPSDLLDALDVAAITWRERTARAAVLALLAYRGGECDRAAAAAAVVDWRGCHVGISPQRLAILAAARAALKRAGAPYGSATAEHVAASVPLLLRGADRAARATTAAGSLPGGRVLDAQRGDRELAPCSMGSTRAGRIAEYAWTARHDRATRGA